ncbi:MAG: hypothetical protein ACFE7R_04370, partial [Candidatus Hodarchaeota archaeon]
KDDGIGDTPHPIPCVAETEDLHPLIYTATPIWQEIPLNQISEYGSAFRYDLNITTPSSADIWWISDTVNFAIDSNGVITNASTIQVGIYCIRVRVMNFYGISAIGFFKVTVQDTTAPTWDQPVEWQAVELGENFQLNLNASDLSGIAQWWIDDTSNFTISSSGIITNTAILQVTDYWLNVRAYDPYDNYCDATFRIRVSDTTPPSWVVAPSDQVLTFGEVLDYQLEAFDLSEISEWEISDTDNFAIDETGHITSITALSIGNYSLDVVVSDSYLNHLYGSFTVMVQPAEGEVTLPLELLLLAGGTIIVLAIVMVIILRRRK